MFGLMQDRPLLIQQLIEHAAQYHGDTEIVSADLITSREVLVLGRQTGRTTLIVAHRFSTIRDVDRILVFAGGRIVADGPREEVYRTNELFRRLWDNQAQGVS